MSEHDPANRIANWPKGDLMRYEKIMVPFDGSEHAANALSAACDLMRDSETSQLHVVTIVPAPAVPPEPRRLPSNGVLHMPVALMDADDYAAVIMGALDEAREDLEIKVRELAEEFGDRVVVGVRANLSPVDGINEYAGENGCDLIVMGRRGLGALRGMLGSVSFGVLRSADCPVLTVK